MDFALIMKLLLCNGVFIVPRPFFCAKAGDRPVGARANLDSFSVPLAPMGGTGYKKRWGRGAMKTGA